MSEIKKLRERLNIKKSIFIEKDSNLLSALKLMDEEDVKLLIVIEGHKFFSVLSIGDIQRAIIKNISLESNISEVLRDDITVALKEESFSDIKDKMLKFRAECMPVIDSESNLVSVYFWDDVFVNQQKRDDSKLNLPVIIMAGGKGTRLQPITNVIPKALVPLGEKPIIEVIIDSFVDLGAKSFNLSVNHKKEMIEFHFSQKKDKQYEVSFFEEIKPLGTAGSLCFFKDKIDSSFFVSNCDIVVSQDYREIYKYHQKNKNDLTVVAALYHLRLPYGNLETAEIGLLKELKEKPEITFLINTGLYLLEPGVLDLVPQEEFFHMTELIEKIKSSGGRVGVFPVSEKSWLDIGQWKEYQKSFSQFKS